MHFLGSDREIIILKRGLEIQTLSRYAPGINIFNRMIEGNNCSYFLPADQPFENWRQGRIFHQGWDDFAPWMSSAYKTIGANHGSPFTFRVSMLRHWYSPRDIGKILADEKGNGFIITALENAGNFLIHGLPRAPGSEPLFSTEVSGALFDSGVKLETGSITQIQMPQPRSEQLSPHYRHNSFILYADGKILEDDVICTCRSAEAVWDFDLILPDTLVEYLKKNPGRHISPTASGLDPSLHHLVKLSFLPECAWHYAAKVTVERDLPGYWKWGLLQHYGTLLPEHAKFLPKLAPITLDSGETVDLDSPVKVVQPTHLCYRCTGKDCIDPEDPPNRYIDLFGTKDFSELGVVLDYSLSCGITRKGAGERGDINCQLPGTTKIYPYALERQDGLHKGETFELHCCRQYFQPGKHGATACYGRQETDGYWLYADFHSPCTACLEVPQEFAGAPLEKVEVNGPVRLPQNISKEAALTVRAEGRGSFAVRIAAK